VTWKERTCLVVSRLRECFSVKRELEIGPNINRSVLLLIKEQKRPVNKEQKRPVNIGIPEGHNRISLSPRRRKADERVAIPYVSIFVEEKVSKETY
jgi:hypothetical protein